MTTSRRPKWADELRDDIASLRSETAGLREEISHVRDMAEPVATAFRDGKKMLAGFLAAASLFGAIIAAWWSGALAAVSKFLHSPPTP